MSDAKKVAGNSKAIEDDSSSSDEEILHATPTIPADVATSKGDGMKYSCDIIRRNVNMFLATMEMSQAKFLEALGGISEDEFTSFMGVRGREKGKESPFYLAAHAFFEEREKQEREERKSILSSQKDSKANRKRKSEVLDTTEPLTTAEAEQFTAKSIATATAPSASTAVPPSKKGGWQKPEIDVLIEQVHKVDLPDTDKVYDDCDEIRRKISIFVEEEAFSITKFAFAIRTTPSVVNRFLARKGKDQGAGSEVYKKSFIFFEKLRVLRNEPKSKHRINSEREYPEGYSLKNPKGEK